MNWRMFHEDAGAFELDRTAGVLTFQAFPIHESDDVLIGAALVNVLEAIAEAAKD